MTNDGLLTYLADPSRRNFRRLIESEQAAVFGAAWRVLGDRAAAEDVTQELFMGLLDGRGGRKDVHSGRGFLVSRAIGLARTRLRSERRRRRRESSVASTEQIVEGAVPEAVLHEVRDAILGLPEASRECVELRYFGGLSAREIAERLGCARRTVHDRLRAGHDALRRRLSPQSAALLAPVLDGGGLPPSVPLSPRFEAELLGLAEEAMVAGASGSIGIWGVLALVAVIATSVALGFRGGFGDGGSPGPMGSEGDEPGDGPGTLGVVDPGGLAPVVGLDPGTPGVGRLAVEGPSRGAGTTGLRIRIRDEGGQPVVGATVEISARKLRTLGAIMDLREGEVAPEIAALLDPMHLEDVSEFEVDGLPDALCELPFEVGAIRSGFAAAAPQGFTLLEGTVVEVVVVLPRPLRTRLTLVDSTSGEPVDGATAFSITELERRGLDPKEVWQGVGPARATSDVLGEAWLDGLGPGLHHVEVSAGGYRNVVLWECEAGVPLEVPMTPTRVPGRIVARVRDPFGEAVVDFPVQLSPVATDSQVRVFTDAEGRAHFEGLHPDGYTVGLPADAFAKLRVERGYMDSPVHFVPHPLYGELSEGETLEMDLGYVPGNARWDIRVVDSEGVGLAGEEVLLRGPFQLDSTTDGGGLCRFEHLPPGTWALTVGGIFGGFDFERPTLGADEVRMETIVLGSAVVSGTVVIDETGVSPPRSFLSLSGPCTATTHSMGGGKFTLERVPPGDYQLRCSVPGFATARVPVRVGSDPLSTELRLVRGGSIAVDRSEAWTVPGAVVRLVEAGLEDYLLAEESGTEEHFTFEHLQPGEYLIRATAPGRDTVERRARVVDRGVTVLEFD